MSVDRPSHDPQWHSSQARSIERLSRALSVLATPVRLFWRIYYAIVGRLKPLAPVTRTILYWDKHAKPHGKWVEKPVPLMESPVAYTIPIEGRIPPIAMIWNREQGHYDVYEEGKPPRTMADPWPDSPKTVREFLEKYPPVTAEEWLRRQGSIGKYANFPPSPDRPMMIARIEPLLEPEGDKTHGLYAELGEDIDGFWFINGTPIRLTEARLLQTQRVVGDRLAAFIRYLVEQAGDEPLNLDNAFQRAEIRNRAQAVVKTALIEDGYNYVRNVCIRFIKTRDGDLPEITLAMRAMVTYHGVDLEISGPQAHDDAPSLFPEDQ